MKLKKFGEFINEDIASGYDIEKPFTGDGDDLSTQDDETTDLHDDEDEFHSDMDDMDDIEDSEEDEMSDIKKLVIAKIIAGEISDEKIEALLSDGDEDIDSNGDEDIDSNGDEDIDSNGDEDIEDSIEDDMDEEDEDMGDEENHFFPKMSLEESLKFKNFRKRK